MVQAVSRRTVSAEARVRSCASHVRSVEDTVAPAHVFVRVLRFYPVSMISPVFHIYLYLNTSLVRRTSGRNRGAFKRSCVRYSNKTSECT